MTFAWALAFAFALALLTLLFCGAYRYTLPSHCQDGGSCRSRDTPDDSIGHRSAGEEQHQAPLCHPYPDSNPLS